MCRKSSALLSCPFARMLNVSAGRQLPRGLIDIPFCRAVSMSLIPICWRLQLVRIDLDAHRILAAPWTLIWERH